ncbi:hypothetical protein ACFCVO_10785 [Agromyces sp. NPDC056379]|uniref:hypothetical protein n=1 Tax=unclassified Agromyces TaxID=2639701 RepID=UPI0035DC073E
MQRSQRIVFASFLVLFAVVAVLLSASAIQLSYQLDDGTATMQHTVFEPAVVSTVIASAVGILQLGFLIWNLVSEPPVFTWWIALGLTVVACGWTIFMLFQPTPLF